MHKIPSLAEYEAWIIEDLSNYIKDEKALNDYMKSSETKDEIQTRYTQDIKDYKAGKITYNVLRVGCPSSVAYCLWWMY